MPILKLFSPKWQMLILFQKLAENGDLLALFSKKIRCHCLNSLILFPKISRTFNGKWLYGHPDARKNKKKSGGCAPRTPAAARSAAHAPPHSRPARP